MIPKFRRIDLLKEAIESIINQKTNYLYTINIVDNDCAEAGTAGVQKLLTHCSLAACETMANKLGVSFKPDKWTTE